MSPKNMKNEGQSKNPVSLRLIAVLLAVLMIFSAALVNAEEVGNNENPVVTEENQEQVTESSKEIHISAKDKTVTLEEAKDLDFLEGVTAADEDEKDYTEFLSYTKAEDFNEEEAGEYLVTYYVVVDDETLATQDIKVTITNDEKEEKSDYEIKADTLNILKDTKDVDYLTGVTATDLEGNDVSKDLTVDSSNVDLTTVGEYTINYTLSIDGEVKAELERTVVVTDNGIIFSAPELSLFTDAKTESFLNKVFDSMSAIDADGNILTEYIVMTDDGGGEDFIKRGNYEVSYAIVKDGETLAQTTRTIRVDPIRISLFNTSVTMGGDRTGTIKDSLKLVVKSDGRMDMRRWMKKPGTSTEQYVVQYFNSSNSDSNGMMLNVEGTQYGLSSYHGLSTSETTISVGNIQRDSQGNQTVVRTYTINNTNHNIVVEETIVLYKGSDTVNRTMKIKNNSGRTLASTSRDALHLIYGGDTYFGGYDSGWANQSNQNGNTVSVYRDETLGTMTLTGDPSTPATYFYAGTHASSRKDSGSLGENTFPTTVARNPLGSNLSGPNPDPVQWNATTIPTYTGTGANYHDPSHYVDTNYYLQWNRNTLTDGASYEVKSYETFSAAGDIQLTPGGDRVGAPGGIVAHTFTVKNQSFVGQRPYEVKFSYKSDRDWEGIINPQTVVLKPNETKQITVIVWIPAKQPNGTDWPTSPETQDGLTLYADYQEVKLNAQGEVVERIGEVQQKAAQSTTMTSVRPGLASITNNPITNLTPDSLTAAVEYINVPTAKQPVKFKLTIQNDDYSDTGLNLSVTSAGNGLASGGTFPAINISQLTNGKTYRLLVECIDGEEENAKIQNPYNSTTFIKGQYGVSSITLNPKTATVAMGSTYNGYVATVNPSTATNKKVNWVSANESIAKVNRETGVVTPVSVGKTTIRATSDWNALISDTAEIEVIDITAVNVTPNNQIIKKGSTQQMQSEVLPATAVNKTVTWSATGAGSINANGLVTGTTDGTVAVTAKSNVNQAISGTANVKVDGTNPVATIPSIAQQNAQNWKVSYTANDPTTAGVTSGIHKIYYKVATTTPTFSATDASWTSATATATGNFVVNTTGLTAGRYNVYVVLEDKVGNFSNNGIPTTADPAVVTPIDVVGDISNVNPSTEQTIAKDAVINASIDITPVGTKVTWTASPSGVVNIVPSADGKTATIKGVADGKTTVTISSVVDPSKTATIKVNVDGTKPQGAVAVTKQAGVQKWSVAITATDPTVNNFASGIDKIYYKVATSAPTFNPNDLSTWTETAGTAVVDAANLNPGRYKVYTVVKDKVGNWSTVSAGEDANNPIDVVGTISVNPSSEQIIKKDASFSAMVTIDPAGTQLTWTADPANLVTITANADGKSANIKGIADGISVVTVASREDSSKKTTITVKIDGTKPVVSNITLVEQPTAWRGLINTNKQIKAKVTANDPETNYFASGLKNVYAIMVKDGVTVPAFSETSTDWKKVDANGEFIFGTTTAIKNGSDDGDYRVYAIAVDNVNNIGDRATSTDTVKVITKLPEIEFPNGGTTGVTGKVINVLIGTTISSSDYRAGIKVNGATAESDSNLFVDSSTVDTNMVGVYTVKYKYTDAAGNISETTRRVNVHGKPSIAVTSAKTIHTTAEENASINLLNNSKFTLEGSAITFNTTESTTGIVVPANFKVDSITGATLAADGKTITIPTIATGVQEIKVTYRATYRNDLLGQDIQSDGTETVTIKVYPNGQNPEGETPTPIHPGVITPGKPGVPSTDPQSKAHINFYQNNGTIKSDGTKQAGNLSINDITGAVQVANPASTTIIITINGQALNVANLNTALATAGTKTIEYKATTAGGAITTYTVNLLVNTDLTTTNVATLDVVQGDSVNAGVPAGMTAIYTNYMGTVVNPNIATPTSINTTNVDTFYANYVAAYPYVDKEINAMIRVHGKVQFNPANEVHVRVGDTNITSDLVANVTLAPVTVGAPTPTPTTVNIATSGVPNCNTIHSFNQAYTGTATLPAGYNNPSFVIENTISRKVSIHGKPEITVTNPTLSIPKGMTAAKFGSLLTKAGVSASIKYCEKNPIAITNSIVQGGQSINFGVVGSYTVTLDVDDSSVTACPTTLAPMPAPQKTVTVNVIDGNVGDEPNISGSMTMKKLVGDTVTETMIKQGITARNPNRTASELTYEIRSLASGGAVMPLANLTNTVGKYEVIYTAFDNETGNTKEESLGLIDIYGKVELSLNATGDQVSRQTATLFSLKADSASAQYQDSDGTMKNMAIPTEAGYFATNIRPNLTQIGRTDVLVTVTHPVIASNTDSKTLAVKVYGPIVIENVADKSFRVGDRITANVVDTTGVTAYYLNENRVKTPLQVTSNPDIIGNKGIGGVLEDFDRTEGPYVVTYKAEDLIVGDFATRTATIKIEEDGPVITTSKTAIQFKRGKISSPAALLIAIGYNVKDTTGGTTAQYTFQPLTVTGVKRTHFVPNVNLNKVGSYTVKIYAVDANGANSNEITVLVQIQ